MAEKTDIERFLDWSHRWVVEGIYPIIGGVVNNGVTRLEAEGFTKEEARFWLEALTILQIIRIDMPVPPHQYRVLVPDPPVLTEADIMRMIAAGETIPAMEYEGFEGRY